MARSLPIALPGTDPKTGKQTYGYWYQGKYTVWQFLSIAHAMGANWGGIDASGKMTVNWNTPEYLKAMYGTRSLNIDVSTNGVYLDYAERLKIGVEPKVAFAKAVDSIFAPANADERRSSPSCDRTVDGTVSGRVIVANRRTAGGGSWRRGRRGPGHRRPAGHRRGQEAAVWIPRPGPEVSRLAGVGTVTHLSTSALR